MSKRQSKMKGLIRRECVEMDRRCCDDVYSDNFRVYHTRSYCLSEYPQNTNYLTCWHSFLPGYNQISLSLSLSFSLAFSLSLSFSSYLFLSRFIPLSWFFLTSLLLFLSLSPAFSLSLLVLSLSLSCFYPSLSLALSSKTVPFSEQESRLVEGVSHGVGCEWSSQSNQRGQ